MDDFGFSEPCITNQSFASAQLEAGGPDNWQVEGIVVTIRSGSETDMVIADYYINAWLEADVPSTRVVDLTIVV